MKTTAVMLLLCGAIGIHGEMKVAQYKIYKQSSDRAVVETVGTYLKGLGDGISISDALSERPAFCPPDTLGLVLANYTDMIDKQIASFASHNTEEQVNGLSIGILLLRGLKETFPCPKSSKQTKQ
jgi:hypothetical protein